MSAAMTKEERERLVQVLVDFNDDSSSYLGTALDEAVAELRRTADYDELREKNVAAMQSLAEWDDRVAQLQARCEAAEKDKARLDALAAEYWKLDPFDMPTGQGDADVGWRVVQYHQGEPHERTVAEVYEDDPRKAIDAAMAGPSVEVDACMVCDAPGKWPSDVCAKCQDIFDDEDGRLSPTDAGVTTRGGGE